MTSRTTTIPCRRRTQRGIATILILLLVALAVTVTVLIVAYSLRGGQQRQLTVHATTAAQGAAWRGVEVLRAGLSNVAASQVSAWSNRDGWDLLDQGSVIPASGSGSTGVGQASGGGSMPASGGTGGGGGWVATCDSTDSASGVIHVDGLDGLGINRARLVEVCRTATNGIYRVTAQVTGTAGEGSALTTSTVEVVYTVTPGSGSSGGVCASIPPALMVFNGDLNITGGSLGVTGNSGDQYENIAVSGNLTVGSSSSARISGCAKGNITLSGGGITSNGHLHAEGAISVSSMTPPDGTTFWARAITLDGSSSGARYAALKAGAYAASVMVGDAVVGSTRVGGTLIPSTAAGGIPWTTGVVVPSAQSATFVVTLTDNSQFVFDPRDLTIDSATGLISGAAAAGERLQGEGTMPDSFVLRSGSIFGGGVTAQGLATTGLVWGHDVSLGLNNGGGLTGSANVTRLQSNGNLQLGTGTIQTLVGGGELWARGGGRSSSTNHWNFPKVSSSGRIAGQIYYSGSRTLLPPVEGPAAAGVQAAQTGTSPGLPGIPFCDARVKAVDAEAYKAQANYIFEFRDGAPVLTIRNVKTAAGASIDGTYNLATGDLRRMPAGTGNPFLTCNWQTDPNNGGAHCFRDATVGGGWKVTGVSNFPKGVVWFDGPFTVDGTAGGMNLINTITGTGKVSLTQAGHGELIAPNFSTPGTVCGGAFWPTNLCDKSGATPAFAQWTDQDGNSHVGLPIGNVAIATEGAGALSGWNIYGSVILGRNLETAANVTVVQGTLTVGANQPNSTTLIDQGGAQIKVPTTSDQVFVPVCEATPAIPAVDGQVQWSRYL